MNFFSRILKFIRSYPSVLYSFALIFILPFILSYNAFLAAKAFQNNVDYNLQTKALIVENILGIYLSDSLENSEILQQKIELITNDNPEIRDLSVALPQQGGVFKIIASQNRSEINAEAKEPFSALFGLSFSREQGSINLISKNGERFWSIIKPVYNKETGEKLGLLIMALSLKESDTLITKTIFRSFIIVIVAIVLSLFLIFHHTRLFGYVSLSEKLQELDRSKDIFIRMATHELQSPIINIRGYLLALEEEVGGSLTQNQKELFSRANLSAKNLSDLVYDILEVSRIEQGRLDFTSQKIFPAKIITEVVQDLKMKAEQKYLKLSLNLKEGSYFINANANRFRQILVNLIENSIKYTPKGEIRVKAGPDGVEKRYVIEVEDTGLGISAENQQKLFERFYRVKTRETADIPGTGLGLWLSKKMCETMGGRIFVESMKDVGTKFTLAFTLTP